jgi:hypothetical protein
VEVEMSEDINVVIELSEMEPQIKGCIKKYSYKLNKKYTYQDLLHEGYTTIINAMKEWDGINNKTSLKQFLWMKLTWHFKSLSEEELSNNYKTDFIKDFKKDLAEINLGENF